LGMPTVARSVKCLCNFSGKSMLTVSEEVPGMIKRIVKNCVAIRTDGSDIEPGKNESNWRAITAYDGELIRSGGRVKKITL